MCVFLTPICDPITMSNAAMLPLLPVYNWVDAAVFGLGFMRPLRPFVLTVGEKRRGEP